MDMEREYCRAEKIELERLSIFKKYDFDVFKAMDMITYLKWNTRGNEPELYYEIQLTIIDKDDNFLHIPIIDFSQEITDNIIDIFEGIVISHYKERGIRRINYIRFFYHSGNLYSNVRFYTSDGMDVDYRIEDSKKVNKFYNMIYDYLKSIKQHINDNLEQYYQEIKDEYEECLKYHNK